MGRLIGRKPIEININSPQGGHLPIYDGDLRIWGTIGSSSLFSSGGLISGSQQVYLTGTTGYNEFSASYTDLSSSFLELSSSFGSATYQGSFTGDGSGLNNVPFSGVTSLAFYSSSVNVKLDALEVESGSIRNNFNSFTSSYRTGSFTGSFKGDGTLLSNIPASGVTGLQLNQIIDGSATASISQLNGLRINVDSEITGSLSVSETISSSFIGNGSGLYNIPATGVTGLELNKIINGSISASLVNNALRVNTDLYVDGTITAKEIHVEYVSSSVLYESGSTKFGDSIDDIHSITGSVLVDGKVKASSLTGSINFTNLTNVPTLVSGSSQIEITGTTGYSTFSGSIASTDLSQNNRLNSIEGVTGSYATTGSNVFIGNQTVTGSLIVTGTVVSETTPLVSGSSQIQITGTTGYSTFSSSLSSSIGELSSSVASTNLGQNNRLDSIEGVTSSLNTFSSSINTTIKNKLNSDGVISGSSQVIYSGLTGIPSGIVSGSLQINNLGFAITGSNIFVGNQTVTGSSNLNGNTTITGSLNVTGSGDITGDLTVRGNLTAQQFIVSSSVTYLTTSFSSGSTKFGDSSDDNHNFTGSVKITGSLNVTNNVLTLTGSLPTPLVIERSATGNSNIQYKNTVGSYYAGITQLGSFAIGSTNNDLGTNAQLSIFPTRGNVIIQNGGSPTDNGYRLQVIGSDAPSGSLYVSGSSNFTGSMVVGINGSEELQVYQSGVTIGNVVTDTHKVTGSLNVSGSILQNGGSLAVQDGTTLYHTIAWFTPSSTVSSSGTTVTSVGTQFTSGMVGAKLTISGESRIITAYTSTTQVTVASAYSQNYGGVASGSWGVFSKAQEILSNGNITLYSHTANAIALNNLTGSSPTFNLMTNMSLTMNGYNAGLVNDNFGYFANESVFANTYPFRWSSTTDKYGTKDLGFRRGSAGTLEIFDGVTNGTYRDLVLRNITGSNATFSGSLNVTGSGTITGNLTVQGNLTAQQFIVSSSVTYLTESFASGSHTFGNTLDDTHNFTGSVLITGSLKVNGVVTGSLNISGSETITGSLFISSSGIAASLIGSGSGVFTVDGTSGRLFQIDDSLSGSLFSVNTAAGLPLMEGFSDNTVRIGQFGQRALFVSQSMVGFGMETPIHKVDISGSLRVTNQIVIGSSQVVNQNTASLASGTQTISTNATSSYTSVFYNYTLASGSNARAGQVMAVWNGNSIAYTDNSTTDIGTTGNVALTASLSTGNVVLSTVLPTTGWTIKSFVNLL